GAGDAVCKPLEDAVANPPTQAEVDRVRTQMLRGLENNLSNPQAIATGALNTAIAQGDWRLMFLQHDELAKVTPADVVRVAKTYLKPSNRTVGYYMPDASPDRTVVADAPDLSAALRDYKSTITVARAESFDPTIPKIESRVVRSKLANGMKVDVLSKKTANNIVSATIELRFGDATTLAGKRDAATFASTLLMAGTKQHTRQQIQDELRRLNAQVNVGGAFAGGRGGGRGGGGGGALQSVNASVSAPGRELPGGDQSGGENPARAAVFDRGVRSRPRTADQGARADADRAEPARERSADAPHEPVREERSAVRAHARRRARRDEERHT